MVWVWVVLNVAGALAAGIGGAARARMSATEEALDAAIRDSEGALRGTYVQDLKDTRNAMRATGTTARAIFALVWWGGVIAVGVSLWMLAS